MATMKVLYVTRKFPPSVGGLETAAYELHKALAAITDTRLVHYGGSNKLLPVVYPWLFLRALIQGWIWRPDVIYLQDGMLAPTGVLLQWLLRRPAVMSVHGLDITYDIPVYQAMVRWCFPRIAHIVAGGDLSLGEIQKRFSRARTAVIPYGVSDSFYREKPRAQMRIDLAKSIGVDSKLLQQSKLIVTTGRLVPRKGVAWFVDEVMARLVDAQPDVRYLVAGKGPDEDRIRESIARQNLSAHVQLLGYISDETRDLLYNSADIFVMPNIPIRDDVEGFGLVALEAASCGTPIVASKIDGIINAVAEGNTGQLLPAADAEVYLRTLSDELDKSSFDRVAVRQYVLDNFSWHKTAAHYLEVFELVAKKTNTQKNPQ